MLGIFIVDATYIVAIIKTIIVARPCEDTITLTAEWENYPAREGGKTTKGENHVGDVMLLKRFCIQQRLELVKIFNWEHLKIHSSQFFCPGHAVYTASWTAAKADVHSQQRFFCLMEEGEVSKMPVRYPGPYRSHCP